MPSTALAAFLTILAGASIATQQIFNGGLRNAVGSVWWAGLVSYLGGTAFMTAALLATGASLPSMATIKAITPLQWSGGVLGGIYVALSLYALPRLGVALVLGLVVVGQMIASIAFDHFGVFGVPLHQISLLRAIGALALVGGVLMIKFG